LFEIAQAGLTASLIPKDAVFCIQVRIITSVQLMFWDSNQSHLGGFTDEYLAFDCFSWWSYHRGGALAGAKKWRHGSF